MTMPSNGPWGPHYSDPDAPHAVYEIWSDQTCLYVGCSFYPTTRINVHAKKPWWPAVTRVTWDYLPNAAAAYAEEERRIKALRPQHNTTHNEKPGQRAAWVEARRVTRRDRHNRGQMCGTGCRECRLIWQAVRDSQPKAAAS